MQLYFDLSSEKIVTFQLYPVGMYTMMKMIQHRDIMFVRCSSVCNTVCIKVHIISNDV